MLCSQCTYCLTGLFHGSWTLFNTIRSALTTLRILRLDLDVNVYSSRHPLRELLAQLTLLSMEENVIEVMCFSFMLYSDLDPGNEWVKLDSLLCRPCWSALKSVSLTLSVSKNLMRGSVSVFHSDQPRRAPAQTEWQDLPSQQFPMLSPSETIKFNFQLG